MSDPLTRPARGLSIVDQAGRRVRRAVFTSLALAAVFLVVALPVGTLPTMWSHGPWSQDPYHVVLSFAVPFVTLVSLLCVLRVPLLYLKRGTARTRRARDLMRASRILVALVLITVTSAWISLLLPTRRFAWTDPMIAAFVGLVVVTVASGYAVHQLRGGFRTSAGDLGGPDWFADTIALGELLSTRLGALRPYVLRILGWADRSFLDRLRRHPVAGAAMLSLGFGITLALVQGIQEGYPVGGYVLFLIVGTAGMFAFTVIAGQHLGLVTDHATVGAEPRPGQHRCIAHVAVAACASVPVAIAFRSAIWSMLGIEEQHFGWLGLNELVLAAAAGTAVSTITIEALLRRSRHRHLESDSTRVLS